MGIPSVFMFREDHPVVEYLLEEEKATWAKVDYQFDLIAR